MEMKLHLCMESINIMADFLRVNLTDSKHCIGHYTASSHDVSPGQFSISTHCLHPVKTLDWNNLRFNSVMIFVHVPEIYRGKVWSWRASSLGAYPYRERLRGWASLVFFIPWNKYIQLMAYMLMSYSLLSVKFLLFVMLVVVISSSYIDLQKIGHRCPVG